jgi:hypothetical protein
MVSSSSTGIQPPSLCPSAHNVPLFKTLNKKVDYAFGLELSDEDRRLLEGMTYIVEDSTPSINQTATFTNLSPLFLNVEVKRQVTNVDPTIQLAVWIGAEFKERQLEGYDRDMPVVAISVGGDERKLWIAFDPDPMAERLQRLVRLNLCIRSFPH